MNRETLRERFGTAFSGSRTACRAISSFALMTFVLLCIRPDFTNLESLADVKLMPAVFLFAAFFIMLSAAALALTAVNTDSFALPIGVLLDSFLLCAGFSSRGYVDNFLFAGGVTLFLALSLMYFRSQNAALISKIRLNKTRTLLIFAILCALFMGFFIALRTVTRYLAFYSPNFDFGIFAHMFRNMKEHGLPITTCERDRLLSHFAVHVSPIYYLILPIYCLFPSPVTLQISQALLLALGAIPLLFICRKRGLSGLHTCMFLLVYALYPAISAGTNYDFHENCFLLPLLMFAFMALEYDKMLPFYISAALVLAVKEDAFIYIIILALFMIAEKRRRLHALIVSAAAVLWFVFCVFMLNRYGEGVMAGRYGNLIPGGEGGLFAIVRTFVLDPGYVVSQIFGGGDGVLKLLYFLLLLLPLGFLPFVSKKPSRWLLAALIAMNLIAASVYQYDIGFQYSFGVSAFLFYAAVINFSELTESVRGALITIALASSLCLWPLFYGAGSIAHYTDYMNGKENFDTIEAALATIPEDASVSASTFFLAHVCNRDEVYEVFYHADNTDVDYVVLDMRPGYDAESREYILSLIEAGFEIVLEKPLLVTILRAPAAESE